MAPPYIKRVLVLLITLLGTAHAPAPGGSNACAADGSSASYSETISMAQGVTKRTIVTNGCPNHESYCTGKPGPAPTCKDKGEQGSDTEAIQQDVNVDIPANPILKSSYTPGELDCSMGAIAYALNGIGFYSGAVGYDADGNCPQDARRAPGAHAPRVGPRPGGPARFRGNQFETQGVQSAHQGRRAPSRELRAEQHAVSGEPAFVAGRRVVVFLPEGLVAS